MKTPLDLETAKANLETAKRRELDARHGTQQEWELATRAKTDAVNAYQDAKFANQITEGNERAAANAAAAAETEKERQANLSKPEWIPGKGGQRNPGPSAAAAAATQRERFEAAQAAQQAEHAAQSRENHGRPRGW